MKDARVYEEAVKALEQADREAVETRRKIAEGEAVNGTSGLTRIHHVCVDALAKVREPVRG